MTNRGTESRGFATLHRSKGYSNHRHADRHHGRVDVVYVGGTTAQQVFAGLRRVPGPGGRQELADIGHLVRLDGVDRAEVRGYFDKNGLLERWHELEQVL